jgi:hypothetical protein
MHYDSGKLYEVVRRRRAERSITKNQITFEEYINTLILEECMREPYCRRHAKFTGLTHKANVNTNPVAYGYRTGEHGVWKPGITDEEAMGI